MNVRGDGPAESERIRTSLLLADAPCDAGVALARGADDVGPHGASADLEMALVRIKANGLIQRRHIEQRAASGELLAAHGMTAAAHAQRLTLASRIPDALDKRLDAARLSHLENTRPIQAGMDIVDVGHVI